MAIKLISKEERFTAEIAGCKFFYRRLPKSERRRIKIDNTSRGVVDEDGCADDAMKFCVLGWEGVEVNGEEAPFNPELLDCLPDPVKLRLSNCILGSLSGEPVEGANPFSI